MPSTVLTRRTVAHAVRQWRGELPIRPDALLRSLVRAPEPRHRRRLDRTLAALARRQELPPWATLSS